MAKKKKFVVQAEICENAKKNISRTKATLSLRGKDLTQAETIDFMLTNYTLK